MTKLRQPRARIGGGLDSTSRYLGSGEIVLKLDSKKWCFGPAIFYSLATKLLSGTGVNAAIGAILPVNPRPILPLTPRVLSHVVSTQFLSENFPVALGKPDTRSHCKTTPAIRKKTKSRRDQLPAG
jgi:hypothetical protein